MVVPVLTMLACTPPDGSGDTPTVVPGVVSDPHVASFFPPTFPPATIDRVVFFGDSITAGEGIANRDNTYTALLLENNDDKWPDHASVDLADRFPDVEVLDVSVNGATTDSVVSWQLPDVDAALGLGVPGPTLVVGTIGGNDALGAIFSGDIAAARAQILDNLATIADFFQDPDRFPDGVWLLVTNVYDPTDGIGQSDACFFGFDLSLLLPDLELINTESLDLAMDQGWAWVDLRGHFLGHGFHHELTIVPEHDPDDPTLWFQEDCIHPNPRGHHELRRLLIAAIDGEPLALDP